MKRRAFLQMTGAVSMGAWLGSAGAVARAGDTEGGDMDHAPLNRELLPGRNQNRSTVVSRHGMVCTSQPLASMAGIDILKSGGNAIDAAIAANAALAVVEPFNCGPGGDLFAIVWIEKDRKLYGLNASGRSPHEWTLDAAKAMGLDDIPSMGPLAWSVPGCVSGWGALHERFGAKPFADVLAASIDLARNGFPVSPLIASAWAFDAGAYPDLARHYMPDGKAPQFGDIFKCETFARFLDAIAVGGAEAFYKGEVAEQIVAYSQQVGGKFTKPDFEDHTVTWVDPIATSYRGYDVWELPPNGQGAAALQILNMLEEFDIGSLEPNSAEQLHLLVEAKKLAFEDRAVFYADMDKADVPLEWLISKDYGKERAKLIDPKRASTSVGPGVWDGTKDTIYLTTSDKDGNMVSLIQSLYYGWGSHMAPPSLGFPIQNRGELFTLDPTHRNRLEPHKRPFHTIIPAFVTKDGNPVFSFGVMGGDFQPQGHVQVLMNIIDFGMSVQQAGEQPRVRHSGSSEPTGSRMDGGGVVSFERHIPDSVMLRMAQMGHAIQGGRSDHGGFQGIWRLDEPLRWFGGSDPRKDGCAIGY
jgi:gamma-glutamyltranspeptidase/glutathione hydrolase